MQQDERINDKRNERGKKEVNPAWFENAAICLDGPIYDAEANACWLLFLSERMDEWLDRNDVKGNEQNLNICRRVKGWFLSMWNLDKIIPDSKDGNDFKLMLKVWKRVKGLA